MFVIFSLVDGKIYRDQCDRSTTKEDAITEAKFILKYGAELAKVVESGIGVVWEGEANAK